MSEPFVAASRRTAAAAPAPVDVGPPCRVSLVIPPLDLSAEAVDELAGRLAERMELAVVERAHAGIFARMRDGDHQAWWPYTNNPADAIEIRITKRGNEIRIGFNVNCGALTQWFRFQPAPADPVG